MIMWKRLGGGYSESANGRFRIDPIWNHATRPQGYTLYDNGQRVKRLLDTQKEAKQLAERIATK